MKFKIGETAHITGIPASALRFYEASGIFSFERDDSNSYRLCSAADLVRLTLTKTFRYFRIPLKEIVPMINGNTGEQNRKKLEEQLKKIESEMEHLTSVRDALKIYLDSSRDIAGTASSFSRCRRGQFYYISVIRNYVVLNEEENKAVVRYIIDNYSDKKYSFIVDYKDGEKTGSWPVRWGIKFSPEVGQEFPARVRRNADYFPACDCFYTGLLRTSVDDLRREELDYVYHYVDRNGFDISGPILGETVEIIPAEKNPHVFYRLSVPVRKKR